MKSIKRILAIVLAFLMVISVVPTTYAAETEAVEEEHVHSYTKETIIKNADHYNTGIKKLECECGAIEYVVIPTQHTYEDKYTEATCTEKAKVTQVCSVCGAEGETQEFGEPTGHDYKWTTTRAATCTEEGEKEGVCSVCKDKVTETIKKLSESGEHTWGEGVAVEASCEAPAGTKYVCSVCKAEKVEATEGSAALGHTWSEWSVTKAATCKEEGVESRTCSVCKKVETRAIEVDTKNGHKAGDDVTVLKEADCKQKSSGVQKYVCTICGQTVYAVIPYADAHAWDTADIKKEATCTAEGEMELTCTICGEKKTEVIKKTAHNWQEKFVEDCELGAHVGLYCDQCKQWKDDEYVAGTQGKHTWGKPTTVKPTCTEEGYDLYTCSVCGATKKENTKAATGHKEKEETVEATCSSEGYTQKVCSVCKTALSDKVVTEKNPEKHANSELVTTLRAAKCAKDDADAVVGIEKRQCKDCGKIFYQTVTPKHTKGKVNKETKATCTAAGSIEYICSECGATITETTKALGHDYVDTVQEAACSVNMQYGQKCSRCGAWNEEYHETVEGTALEHAWDDGVFEEANCEHGDQMVYKCTRSGCKEKKVDDISATTGNKATGHDYEEVETPGTCTKKGYTQNVCKNCGAVEKDTKKDTTTDPDNHPNAAMVGEPLKAAQCAKDKDKAVKGIAKFTCPDCKKTYYATYDAEHEWEETKRVEASCGKDGEITYTCASCGATKKETIPQLAHPEESINEDAYVDATCTDDAVYGVRCEACGTWIDPHYIAGTATGHKVTDTTYVDATCDKGAKAVGICENCGKTVEEDLSSIEPATGHDEKYRVVTPATCKTKGKGEYYCANGCTSYKGKTVEIAIDPSNHESATETVLKEATCTSVGVKKIACTACNKTEYVTIPKLAHSYGDPVVSEDGKTITRTCTVCGGKEEKDVCTEHTMVAIPAVAPTCVKAGLTEGVKCSVCGMILVPQEEVPASAEYHHIVADEAVAPTCTEAGKTGGAHCDICGEVFEAQEEVPATGHTEEIVSGKAATCTEAGLTDGKKCSVCGAVIEEQKEIPAAHTVVTDEAVAPTCTEAGKTEGSHCSVCQEVIVAQEEVPATGHTAVDVEEVAATCTTAGKTAGKVCSVCGAVIEGCEEIPTTGEHVEAIDPAVAATCTEAGKTEGKHCSVCGEVIVAQEEVPAVGHTIVIDEAVEATCGTAGLTEGQHCSVCGEVIVAQEEVPATGEHNYTITYRYNNDYTILYITYTCPDCGDTYTEERAY